MIIDSCPLFFIKFGHPGIHGHTIPEVILHVVRVRICFEYVFDHIFQWLEFHLKSIKHFFVLFDFFLIDVALIHKSVLILFLKLLFLLGQLIDLCNHIYLLCFTVNFFMSLSSLSMPLSIIELVGNLSPMSDVCRLIRASRVIILQVIRVNVQVQPW